MSRKHEDTSIPLYPLTIEEALKKVMNAGPIPEKASGTTPSTLTPPPAGTIAAGA